MAIKVETASQTTVCNYCGQDIELGSIRLSEKTWISGGKAARTFYWHYTFESLEDGSPAPNCFNLEMTERYEKNIAKQSP